MRICDLKQKEVINICSCKSLGCPIDVDFCRETGRIASIILPGPGRFFGLLGRESEFVIPWECIRQIGDDIILAEIREEECLRKSPAPWKES
ncbi:MAG: YlmC/YmxH family sporulation protein [Clostridiales bacterium]|nr:YlmC/YmxH family sporulation protein [Clostridiales bacterium]MCD8153630.1 YlmC/YmxH family sporulation protein [Clostridiales bacterium]